METEKPNFVDHVFNFETESKNEMVNIIQYSVLGVIFVTLLNKGVQTYMPDLDKDKGTVAIFTEIVVQVIILFLAVLFIHRIITYIPTFSGAPYTELNLITAILPVLLVMLSVSKLGEKVSILVDRLVELWEGPKDTKNGKKGQGNVKVSQPISQNQMAMSQSLNSSGTTSISSLPMSTPGPTQQMPDYNSMYQQDPTPLVGAATPSMESFGPMAANEMAGGAFGSAFGGSW
jgi:hypothetical protein